MQGKRLTILVTILLGMTIFFPDVILAKTENNDISDLETIESHIIEGVPYIGQKTNFHCCFASLLMKLQYYGINITLPELLFHSGSGYSLYYLNQSTITYKRLPHYCYQLSHDQDTCKFLADIYGLYHKPWKADPNLPENERWDEDWSRIKENISKDIPVIIRVDEIILANDNLGLGFLYPLIKFFPYASLHNLLLVGFNESNQTVCYNDPIYGIADKPLMGTYRWVELEKFKKSIIKSTKRKGAISSLVRIFVDTPESPISRDEAFNISHNRNIERLKGNYSAYSHKYYNSTDRHLFGINALKRLRKDFGEGIDHRICTVNRYKLNNRLGIGYKLMDFLYFRLPKLFPYHPDLLILELNDCFENIAIEKKHFAEFLSEVQDLLSDENLIRICNYESALFEQEAENWSKLAEYYSEFRVRGVFMSLSLGIQIIKNMANVTDNIIAIEQAIINGPSKVFN
jgi:hypothetical protein